MGWAGRPRALGFLPIFLFRDDGPRWRYVLASWPLTLLPSLLIGYLVTRGAGQSAGPDLGLVDWRVAVLVVLVSPITETVLMTGPLALIHRIAGPVAAVVGSAVLWGVAHSLAAPVWGLVIWWPFLVFSVAYFNWRGRGYWRAVATVSAIHVLQNAAPMALLLVAT